MLFATAMLFAGSMMAELPLAGTAEVNPGASVGRPEADSAASQSPVAVGTANWASMQNMPINSFLRQRSPYLNAAVNSIVEKRTCFFGADFSSDSYDIDIHYAMQLTPEGKVERILVEDKGCRPLETLIASLLLDERFRARIKAPGGTDSRWYSSMIRFSRR